MAEIEVFKSEDGWRFRVKADNGEIVAASEAYTRQEDAERGAKGVKENAPDAVVTFAEDAE